MPPSALPTRLRGALVVLATILGVLFGAAPRAEAKPAPHGRSSVGARDKRVVKHPWGSKRAASAKHGKSTKAKKPRATATKHPWAKPRAKAAKRKAKPRKKR